MPPLSEDKIHQPIAHRGFLLPQHRFHPQTFSPSDYEVITVAHPAYGLADLVLIIFDDFDPFKLLASEIEQDTEYNPGRCDTHDSQGETEFRQIVGVTLVDR